MAKTKIKTGGITALNVTAATIEASLDISGKTVTLPATVGGLGTGIDASTQLNNKVPAANLGTGTASSSTYLAGDQTYKTISEYDDNQLQSNVAMLGFKVATNGSLAKYNLVDQTIDEYNDTTAVDAAASTNEVRNGSAPFYYVGGAAPTVTEDADETGVDGASTWYKWTDTGSTGSYNNDTTQDHEYLIIGGGGSGGMDKAGGGGGGGYLNATGLSLTGGNAYTVTVGAGAANVTSNIRGISGSDSILSGTGISTLTADGGGGGGNSGNDAYDGGSGGGAGYNSAVGVGTAGPPRQGYNGGAGLTSGALSGGGGGGGAAVGNDGTSGNGGSGGAGEAFDILETGTDVYYCGGGGGSSATGGAVGGGTGGGGNSGGVGQSGSAGTNGKGGGGGAAAVSSSQTGAGGSGIVILRRATQVDGEQLTLQSTDTTASTADPNYGDMVCLIENASGTATLNTDIKGYISEDSGVTFTQGTFIDEGTWGTNKKIIAFHDLDISAQSGSAMCYKITTHNQSAGSKVTRIYATSLGWR